jgi:hypothetical protein
MDLLFSLLTAEQYNVYLLDRIYRIFRILSQFPEETEKTQSAFSGYRSRPSPFVTWPPDLLLPCSSCGCFLSLPFELSALSHELSFCALCLPCGIPLQRTSYGGFHRGVFAVNPNGLYGVAETPQSTPTLPSGWQDRQYIRALPSHKIISL